MRRFYAGLGLLVALVACEPTRAPDLHDIYLFGFEDSRLSYFYGVPGSLTVEGTEVVLSEGAGDGIYAFPEALLANSLSYLELAVEAITDPIRVDRIPLTTDLSVTTTEAVPLLLYFDGAAWFTLLEEAEAGLNVRLIPKVRIGRLQGVGNLSPREADTLADVLERRERPLAVSLIDETALPDRSIDGLNEYLKTGLFVQRDVIVDASAFRDPEERVLWEVMAEGSQATGGESARYLMVRNQTELLTVWNQAYGTQLSVPAVPDTDFERETILAIFLGQKPTGGYQVEVVDVAQEATDLFVDLIEREPAEGAITTQALTNPWLMIRVLRGGINAAWFRDPDSGQLFEVARSLR